ncbi:MAG TPA: ABC transporter permease [Microthrixaceae bacterium]|nr:ABC transporter permease [Microthrixaceae bacterium]
MTTFLIRRFGQLMFTLLAGYTLLFLLFFALPGDPARKLAGGEGRAAPPAVVENIRVKYGLDKPIYEQYLVRLKETVTLSGRSFKTQESVRDMVAERLPNSLRLATWAIIIESCVGISLGVLSARRRGSVSDAATTIGAALAGAIPVFILAFLIRQVTGVYAFKHDWPEILRFPPLGIGPDEWYLGIIPSLAQLEYLIQPAIVLASVSTAIVARLTRTTMLEAGSSDHVRTARAKGLNSRTVVTRHTLRNALIPVVTFIGIDFGTLVGFAVLTETVFNWPGIGSKVAQAAAASDFPVMLSLSMVVMLVYGLANLAVDLSYAKLDPRIRFAGAK